MRVLLFQDRFIQKILDGKKLTTIRRSANCWPGDKLSLRRWTGKPRRSKQELIGNCVCRDVLPVEIAESHATINYNVTYKPKILDALAQVDGFSDWPDMLEWFQEQYGLPFHGSLIAWEEVQR